MNSTCNDCLSIELQSIKSKRKGSLTPVYNSNTIPFDIKRVYYLYDIPSLSKRGGHAHKTLQQLIIAVAGSFDVIINDSKEKKDYQSK